MSNHIPTNWSLDCLASRVGKITSGGTPRVGVIEYYGGDIPFLKIDDITSAKGMYVCSSKQTITEKALENSSAKLFPEGTVVTTMYGTIGATAILSKPMATNQAIAAFLDLKGITANYLYQLLISEAPKLASSASQTTQANISGTVLKEYQVLFPPLPEQQKIATILSSVDDVIEKTRTQIDKLKDLKTGMMQELLTKGIGHSEFKDSPVGRIPAAWTAKLLDSVAKRGSGHTPSKTENSYWNGGVKWISLSDSSQLDNLYIHKTKKEISELGLANSSAVLHPAGIVVMARDAGIGKSAITTSPMAVSQHFMAWLCGDRLDNYFLYYLLQYWKPQFENIAMGSTIKTIGLPYFRTMMIPVPPLNEQVKISSSLKAVDETLFRLNDKSDAAHKLKEALMQDLLTGKVRVKVDAQNSAE